MMDEKDDGLKDYEIEMVTRTLQDAAANDEFIVRVRRALCAEAEVARLCVIGKPCARHGFYHGAEAEELREKMEPLANFYPEVRDVLDDVDARDSLAYLEVKREQERVDDESGSG